jgi:DNA uptake protein ComE-like DNA-binding protein
MIDVELLPGISDRLAAELLASRQDVSEAAQFMTSSEALQKVRGIGPSLGATLSAYLSTEESCPES